MQPACMKIALLVFIALFATKARSQTQHSIGPYTTSETERCVCRPHITVNPPVCSRSSPVNSSGTGYNCTTVQETLRTVLRNQETASSEAQGLRRQVDELQLSVSMLVELLHSRMTLQKDCSEVHARGMMISGVYTVQTLGSTEAFEVYCDMETDGGGWTVFQRRQDGSVDFYLDFASYSRGFGSLEGEFWLGNDNLHRLTAQGVYELRVDLTGFDDVTGYAVYDSVNIANVSDNYRLIVDGFSGNAGDSLAHHNNNAFTTKDRDNDFWRGNCAEVNHGAWWYSSCYDSNLNGRYFNEASANVEGIRWYGFSNYRSLKTTEMKIRRKV
ncbi:ficolin-1-like [Asterias rubens]|uniref:ficolin-1-like n=1 Tax=Asterias rubens TaxID=7604 RepID=UPI0014552E1C|nr:ficolin-1-like [Asterias rubens]